MNMKPKKPRVSAVSTTKRKYAKAFDQPSLTHRSFENECNINKIMAQYQKTGSLAHVNLTSPRYGVFDTVVDYQTSINLVMAAQDAFMQLPAVVRKQFDNDPSQFLKFMDDPSNADEIKRLGLTNKLDTPTQPTEPPPAPKEETGTTPPEDPASPNTDKVNKKSLFNRDK